MPIPLGGGNTPDEAFKPLIMTTVADSIEDKDYHFTWVDREGNSDWSG